MARQEFHPLNVAGIDRLCADAVAVTLDVPAELTGDYAFAAGQSLTLRRFIDGRDERRSYSICARVGASPRVAVREVPGGTFSKWLVQDLRPGDRVDVARPTGSFTPDLSEPAHHVLIAAGSGITPVLSIASSVLENPKSAVTLLYGNRRTDTVMFADELAELKDRYPARFELAHVLSREARDAELFTGRLDKKRLDVLLPLLCDPPAVDHWWLCGPFGMVSDALTVLREFGVATNRIHQELFFVEDVPPEPAHHEEPDIAGCAVTVVLDGRATGLTLPAGSTILEGAQRSRPDMPFACKGGVCGTCRARVVNGSVRMRRNFALEDSEVAAGFVLTCQSLPTSDTLTVDYDT
jgi:ring-1,2-phenylacetyl-CoA epoxidase subunit PaaE